MATNQAGTTVNILTGEAITQYACVMFNSSGVLVETTGVASEDNKFVGVAQMATASGAMCPVTLHGTGSVFCIATSTFAIGAKLYTMDDGEVDDVVTSLTVVGIAMEAATAADDIIEVMPIAGSNDDIS